MKILLLGLNARYTHTNLAIRRLKAAAGDLAEIKLLECSINMDAEEILQKIENADAVGFSCYIWNAALTKALLPILKEKGMRLFIGGPEAAFSPEEYLKTCECVFYGEGENAFPVYLRHLLGEKALCEVPSIYYMEGNSIKKTKPAEPVDMDLFSEPYALSDGETNHHRVVYYESSRGCPFRCAYCLSGAEKGLRFRSAKKTIEDMQLYAKMGVKHIKFVDRTFNADRERAKEIWRAVAAIDCESEFHFEIAADLLDEESVEIINSAPKKRIRLEIGVQSTNEKTLQAIDRPCDMAKIARMTKLLSKGNATVHLDLIAGLPYEDRNSFKKSFDETFAFGGSELQLGFLKLLRGSTLYAKAEAFGIICSKDAPYEVIRTSWVTEEDIEEMKKVEYALGRLYNSGLFRQTTRLMAKHFHSCYEALLAFDAFAGDLHKLGEKAMAEALYAFGKAENIPFMRDILRYDMIKKERRGYLPDILEDGAAPEKKKYYAENPDIPGLKKGKRAWHYSRLEKFALDVQLFAETGEILEKEHYLFFDYINDDIFEVKNMLQYM